MKFPQVLIALILVFSISCKKGDDNQVAIDSISGHWHILDFEPSANSPENESMLAKEAIFKLVERSCDPLEYTFKTDGTVSYEDGMRYLSISSNEGNVEVSCAPQYDLKVGTFDYDNTTLTLNFEDGDSRSYPAAVEGQNFTVQVEDMLINGVIVRGKLIYTRETGD